MRRRARRRQRSLNPATGKKADFSSQGQWRPGGGRAENWFGEPVHPEGSVHIAFRVRVRVTAFLPCRKVSIGWPSSSQHIGRSPWMPRRPRERIPGVRLAFRTRGLRTSHVCRQRKRHQPHLSRMTTRATKSRLKGRESRPTISDCLGASGSCAKRGVAKLDRRLGSRSTCRKGIRSWKQREFQNDQESSWQIGGPFSPAAAQDLHGSSRGLWPLASWWQCQSTQTSVFRLFLDFGKFGGIDWMHRPAACWSARRAMLAAATASPRQCRCSRLSSGRAFIGLPSLSGAYWLRLQWCQYSVDKEPRTQPVFRCRGRACLCLGIRGMFALFMDGSTMQCARSTSVFVAQLERQAASHTRSHVSGHSVCVLQLRDLWLRTHAGVCQILPQFWLAHRCALRLVVAMAGKPQALERERREGGF